MKILRSLAAVCFAVGACYAASGPAVAAEFEIVSGQKHGAWGAYLFRNKSSNRLFCALEARSAGTDFRINRYLDTKETFLEVYNPNWTLMEGEARFSLAFVDPPDSLDASLAGKSWGDSYTHDFTDVKNYLLILGLIVKARSFTVKNSNGSSVADFSGSGSSAAIRAYNLCVNR